MTERQSSGLWINSSCCELDLLLHLVQVLYPWTSSNVQWFTPFDAEPTSLVWTVWFSFTGSLFINAAGFSLLTLFLDVAIWPRDLYQNHSLQVVKIVLKLIRSLVLFGQRMQHLFHLERSTRSEFLLRTSLLQPSRSHQPSRSRSSLENVTRSSSRLTTRQLFQKRPTNSLSEWSCITV